MPPAQTDKDVRPGARRDRIAQWFAVATVVCLAAILFGTAGLNILMPGPLASAHGGVEACSACHTNSGKTKLSWLHGLVAGDRAADSKACLTCHKMPETALNAHGAPAEVLKESTVRLTKLAMEKTGAGSPGCRASCRQCMSGIRAVPFAAHATRSIRARASTCGRSPTSSASHAMF